MACFVLNIVKLWLRAVHRHALGTLDVGSTIPLHWMSAMQESTELPSCNQSTRKQVIHKVFWNLSAFLLQLAGGNLKDVNTTQTAEQPFWQQ